MAPRVAVVGAGPLGLMALKNFKEDGFEVACFDGRSAVGGLWHGWHDNSLSAHAETIFNSSKYRAAISDFPFSDDVSDFPTAPQLHQYFEDYCDFFGLRKCIQLNTRVTSVERSENQWELELQRKDGTSGVEFFDKVVVSTGTFSKPKIPTILGIDKFEGKAMHSIEYQDPEQHENQNVLVIGAHATAQDVIHTLAGHAKKVYISHRHGVTLLPQYNPNGAVFDATGPLSFTFFQEFANDHFPAAFTWLIDTVLASMSHKAFPEGTPAFKMGPGQSIAVAPPVVSSSMGNHINSGFAQPVTSVQEVIGPKTIRLTDGSILSDIDTILYCTGYHMDVGIPIKDYQVYPVQGEAPYLYRNIFPITSDPWLRNSLAILGQSGIPFPGFVQHELISMAISQIWQGKSSLPDESQMQAWHNYYLNWRAELAKRYQASSTFFPNFQPYGDHFRWLDETAGAGLHQHFGWTKLAAWKFWWYDRETYNKALNGLFSPAVWRLFETGKRKTWIGAKSQIFIDNENVEVQQKTRLAALKKNEELAKAHKL